MITELRKKSQITIPKEVVLKLGLKEGDKLEIIERDGEIKIIPIVVYPKRYLAELKEEIIDIKTKIKLMPSATPSIRNLLLKKKIPIELK